MPPILANKCIPLTNIGEYRLLVSTVLQIQRRAQKYKHRRNYELLSTPFPEISDEPKEALPRTASRVKLFRREVRPILKIKIETFVVRITSIDIDASPRRYLSNSHYSS